MSAAGDDTTPEPPHCSACGASLARDQRYCLDCGTRRGPLPAEPAAFIAAMLEQYASTPDAMADTPDSVADEPDSVTSPPPEQPARNWIPSPRAAAAAVLGMLTFGMFLGSVTGPGLASTLSAPERIFVSLAPSGGSNSNANSGDTTSSVSQTSAPTATTITQTVTVAAPASPGGSVAPVTQPAAPGGVTPPAGSGALPPVKHVFLIVLSGQGYSQTFGSTDPYFSQTLPKQGGLVPNYFGVTAGELANGIAMISGQGPTPQTAADCPLYTDLTPGGSGSLGQALGTGCVYPKTTKTLADELGAPNKGGWKAYIEGIDTGPKDQPSSCRHPAVGAADGDTAPRAADPYVTWRNPFVYFHSVIDGASCATNDIGLKQLATDLKTAKTTPALSYIAPSPCDDGSDQPCAPGAAAGLAPAAKFLQTVVPEIERSPAYKADGLLAVTFDQAPQSGPHTDTNGCCMTQAFPNLPAGNSTTSSSSTTSTTSSGTGTSSTASGTTTSTTTTGTSTSTTSTDTSSTDTTSDTGLPGTPAGGGQVGIVLISRWVKPGSTDFVDSYNHFSLLASIEKMLGVPRLGYANDPSLPLFGPSVFSNYFG